MQTPTPPPSATPTSKSKRKRHTTDSGSHLSPSPTRLKTTNLPTRPLSGPDEEGINPLGSPRTTIIGHLQELDIQEQVGVTSNLDFGMGKRKSESSNGAFAPQVLLPKNQTYSNDKTDSTTEPVTPPSSSHGYPAPAQPASSHPHLNLPSTLEIPESPPTTASTTTTTTTTYPLPTPDPRLGNKSPIHTSNPSPASSSSLWWTDTEITGHNPSDPTDDGYGINGVGFVPTPAMASARAEKRRRQVREWKEREARDARARRGMRRQRNRGGEGKVAWGREEGMEDGVKGDEGPRKEVRFSDVMEVEVG